MVAERFMNSEKGYKVVKRTVNKANDARTDVKTYGQALMVAVGFMQEDSVCSIEISNLDNFEMQILQESMWK